VAAAEALVFLAFLIAAAASDLRSRRIPNRLNAAGLVAVAGFPASEGAAALAACLGWAVVVSAGPLAIHLARPSGLGGGDVKMMAVIGAALGPVAPIALLVGCLVGLFALPLGRAAGWVSEDVAHIPLAPFLGAGALAAMAAA